jgi:N-acetylmuramoyl-L-alanine amidase
MVKLYGRKGKSDRGLKELGPGDRGYESCSSLDIPSALIEPFFGDNPDDARLGHDTKQELAVVIASAMRAQLGL